MCHVPGCVKEVSTNGDEYTCTDSHTSKTVPAVTYRININMKSCDSTEHTTIKVLLRS